jgi:hypothetical protein
LRVQIRNAEFLKNACDKEQILMKVDEESFEMFEIILFLKWNLQN